MIGGGTVVIPELTHGRLDPGRVLLLAKAGLGGVSADGDTVTIGAAASIESLLDLGVDALAACARNVADVEIRGQATVGGNLCVGGSGEAPRGDLQGCLLALGAQVRSAGAGGERTEPLEDFLANRHGRLVLDVSFERPAASAFAALEYPHTHEYTVLAVSGARTASRRDAARRDGRRPGRAPGFRSAEAKASDPEAAGAAAVGGRRVRRRRARVRLVPRADASRARPPCPHPTPGVRMNLTVNGVDTAVEAAR